MSKSGFTLVFYYIPQDSDDLKYPNAFALPKDYSEITLNDIEANFPLEGEYVYRFQYSHDGENVWLDINNKQVAVPSFNKKIIMKVTRLTPLEVDQENGV